MEMKYKMAEIATVAVTDECYQRYAPYDGQFIHEIALAIDMSGEVKMFRAVFIVICHGCKVLRVFQPQQVDDNGHDKNIKKN